MRATGRLIRERPRLLLRLLAYLAVGYGILISVLLVFDSWGSFDSWVVIPAIMAGSAFGTHLRVRHEAFRKQLDEDLPARLPIT